MLTADERKIRIGQICNFPDEIESLIANLSEEQLQWRISPQEWSILQIIHHLADAHMNGFIRIKNVLTEDNPIIASYDQDKWSATWDIVHTPIDVSFTILRGLHPRLVLMFEHAKDSDWERSGTHTEGYVQSLDDLLVVYSNHGQEHIQQIQTIIENKKG